MASKPRTPEHFPRMKVRGKARRAMRQIRLIEKACANVIKAFPAMAEMLTTVFTQIGEAAAAAAKAFADAFLPQPTRQGYGLIPIWVDEHQLLQDAVFDEMLPPTIRLQPALTPNSEKAIIVGKVAPEVSTDRNGEAHAL